MNIFKINRSLALNLSAIIGWISILVHLIFAQFTYIRILFLERKYGSIIETFYWIMFFNWLVVIKILAVLVALILLALLLRLLVQRKFCWQFNAEYKHNRRAKIYFYTGLFGNIFPFILPFICELFFREDAAGHRVIFYGALILILIFYSRKRNKQA